MAAWISPNMTKCMKISFPVSDVTVTIMFRCFLQCCLAYSMPCFHKYWSVLWVWDCLDWLSQAAVLLSLLGHDTGCATWEMLWHGQWRSEKASSQSWVSTPYPDLWVLSPSSLCEWAHAESQVRGACCSCPCMSCSPDWQLYCGAKGVENLEAVLLQEWPIKWHVFVQKHSLFSLNKKENSFGISRAEKYFFNRAVRKWN